MTEKVSEWTPLKFTQSPQSWWECYSSTDIAGMDLRNREKTKWKKAVRRYCRKQATTGIPLQISNWLWILKQITSVVLAGTIKSHELLEAEKYIGLRSERWYEGDIREVQSMKENCMESMTRNIDNF